jgi:hypothetical protein
MLIAAGTGLGRAESSRRPTDDLTALMHRNLQLDAVRSRRWSVALAQVAVTDAPANAQVLSGWIGEIEAAVMLASRSAGAAHRLDGIAPVDDSRAIDGIAADRSADSGAPRD